METIPAAPEERQVEAAQFVDRLVGELEPLQRLYNESLWMASVTGEAAHVEESARLDTQIRQMFARPEPYDFLCRVESNGGVSEPLLKRQLDLLLNNFRAHQVPAATLERMVRLEKSLDSRFNNFRAELNGRRVTDNGLREVLRNSNDSAERQRAWEASKQIGAEVVDELLELVRVRNQAAREVGFGNYYSMTLTIDELDEDELFEMLDDLERRTRTLFGAYKHDLDGRLARRFGVPVDALRPWHYADPFFQEAPAAEYDLDPIFSERSLVDLTERYYAAVGFEIRDVLERSDLYEKPGKSQHAFCISMDHGEDVRVLCNLKANEHWMSTMLHELGHAVYEKHIDRSLPYLLRTPAHTLTTEASAMLFGRLSKNAAWLRRYAGMGAEEARSAEAVIGRAVRAQLLVQTRWCLVMCHMERELYRDPERDLTALWWGLVERFQGLRRPEGRNGPDWASKIHFSVAPVYYHNYALGEIMASQLQASLLGQVGGEGDEVWDRYVESPEVGGYLKENLFRYGKAVDWRQAIRRATGQDLSPATFVGDLARRE